MFNNPTCLVLAAWSNEESRGVSTIRARFPYVAIWKDLKLMYPSGATGLSLKFSFLGSLAFLALFQDTLSLTA